MGDTSSSCERIQDDNNAGEGILDDYPSSSEYDSPASFDIPLPRGKSSQRGEPYKVWKARKRELVRFRAAYPWHYFRLAKPNRSRDTKQFGWRSDTSDSEDEHPRRDRILGNYKLQSLSLSRFPEKEGSTQTADAREHILTETLEPLIAPHTCKYCSKICIDLSQQSTDLFLHNDKKSVGSRNYRDTDITYSDIIEAVTNGCTLFSDLATQIYELDDDFRLSTSRMSLQERVEITTDELSVCLRFLGSKPDQGAWSLFQLFTPPGTKVLHEAMSDHLPPNLVPNSQLSFSRVRNWLSDCVKNHDLCNAYKQTFTPKRLLEISEQDGRLQLRLCCNPKSSVYATLSYCWGGDQPGKTTTSCLSSYEKDIMLESVPETIRDAVVVTANIGLRYLWVDALCIIQNDEIDLGDQLAQMHQIYRSSTITIAAAAAENSRKGFLHLRELWRPIKLSARYGENVFGDIILVPPCDEDSFSRYMALHQRGWTFQELALSTRAIAYGHREMMFKCLQCTQVDGGHGSIKLYETMKPGSNSMDSLPHPASWCAIFSAYSARELSDEGDKLVGIAALAEEYAHRQHATRYYAGLWKEDFWKQCLWIPMKPIIARRPKEYRAPSWSWASLDGTIVNVDWNELEEEHDRTKWYNLTSIIIDIQITLAPRSNKFGAVTGGSIRLQTRTKPVVYLGDNNGRLNYGKGCGITGPGLAQSNEFDFRLRLHLDIKEEWDNRINDIMWTAEICTVGGESLIKGYGFLLEEVKAETNTYKRIGRLDLGASNQPNQSSWFSSGSSWREITIV